MADNTKNEGDFFDRAQSAVVKFLFGDEERGRKLLFGTEETPQKGGQTEKPANRPASTPKTQSPVSLQNVQAETRNVLASLVNDDMDVNERSNQRVNASVAALASANFQMETQEEQSQSRGLRV